MTTALALTLSACGPAAGGGAGETSAAVLRLGYFPNLTHATAIVGVAEGLFTEALGPTVELQAQAFNAGPDVVEAIFSGALDASYIGPSPAINAFVRSNGEAIRIVAGATSGGAALIVKPEIEDPADLAGRTLATPQLGNTQDVALRAWLASEGYATDLEGGGDVSIMPQPNGQALEAFISGAIDGAWVPEPWATRMIDEGGGMVLVDERDLWPEGEFVTTQLIVATSFLEAHPDVVKRLLEGHVAANDFVNERPEEAQRVVAASIADVTDTELPEGTLAIAWSTLTFTNDPIADSLTKSANDALQLGLLDSADLHGIHDLTLLNQVLTDAGEEAIEAS